ERGHLDDITPGTEEAVDRRTDHHRIDDRISRVFGQAFREPRPRRDSERIALLGPRQGDKCQGIALLTRETIHSVRRHALLAHRSSLFMRCRNSTLTNALGTRHRMAGSARHDVWAEAA